MPINLIQSSDSDDSDVWEADDMKKAGIEIDFEHRLVPKPDVQTAVAEANSLASTGLWSPSNLQTHLDTADRMICDFVCFLSSSETISVCLSDPGRYKNLCICRRSLLSTERDGQGKRDVFPAPYRSCRSRWSLWIQGLRRIDRFGLQVVYRHDGLPPWIRRSVGFRSIHSMLTYFYFFKNIVVAADLRLGFNLNKASRFPRPFNMFLTLAVNTTGLVAARYQAIRKLVELAKYKSIKWAKKIPDSPHTVSDNFKFPLLTMFFSQKIIRGALTDGAQWMFFILTMNDDFKGGTVKESTVIDLEDVGLIPAILLHWVRPNIILTWVTMLIADTRRNTPFRTSMKMIYLPCKDNSKCHISFS